MEDKLTVEQSFEKMDELLQQLQQKDLPLEESFKKYQEGLQLVQNCNSMIDKIEKELEVLNAENFEE